MKSSSLMTWAGLGLLVVLSAEAQLPVAIKGIAYQSYKEGGYSDGTQDPVLDFLADTGANWISFNTPFIFDRESQRIMTRSGVTDFDGLPMALVRAKQRGLQTALYVFVQTDTYGSLYDEGSRPRDVADFFGQLKALVLRYADLAQREGVGMLILGNEMNSISGPAHRAQWLDIIDGVRQRYAGKLTYSAIPNYFNSRLTLSEVNGLVSFWERLDYIGFSFYPQLAVTDVPTRAEIEQGWTRNSNLLQNMKAWNALTGKPVLFVEVGYQSVNGAAIRPGNSVGGQGVPNESLQAQLYDVMFSQVSKEGGPWLQGMFLWCLDTWNRRNSSGYYSGGYRAVDFSFFEKPAGDVVRRWYSGR